MHANILLVDDEQDFLNLTKKFIEKFNNNLITIKTTNSSIDALNLLKKKKKHFDIIISDFQIPELDGLELLKKIRQDLKLDTSFILMTGHGREEVAVKTINLGVNYYIQKTPNLELICPCIKSKASKIVW